MLNWIRDKLFRRETESVIRSSNPEESVISASSNLYVSARSTMYSEHTSSLKLSDKILLHIIHGGEIWSINVDRQQLIADITDMAISHFYNPKELPKFNLKYKLISILSKRVLHPQYTVKEEELKTNDEILLATSVSTGVSTPIKLTIEDIKGPSKDDVMAATAHLTKKNAIKVVPAFDCQENFQSEIRKVLYSLALASANILAQSPDAKLTFEGIAARINAKNKKEIDKNAVKYLKDLGFTEVQARYALRLKRNRQIEAMEWLLDNSHRVKEDSAEYEAATSTSNATTSLSDSPLNTIHRLLQDIQQFHKLHFEPSPRALDNLQAMGFPTDDAVEALRLTANNQVAACEWLCGERDPSLIQPEPGLDTSGPLYKALINNPAIQLGLQNPKIMLAFLSILENPSCANLWLNDVDTSPVLGQVFKTYHSEKHILVVNQQLELMHKQQSQS